MIEVELKHDVNFKKSAGLAVVLGVAVGASAVITKECIDYSKNKIKKIKNKKNKLHNEK